MKKEWLILDEIPFHEKLRNDICQILLDHEPTDIGKDVTINLIAKRVGFMEWLKGENKNEVG